MTFLIAKDPGPTRIAILIALVVAYVVYHVVRRYLKRRDAANAAVPGASAQAGLGQGTMQPSVAAGPGLDGESAKAEQEDAANGEPADGIDDANLPGAEDYFRARAMVHQEIPDFRIDGLYLDMLGEAAEKGFGRAMAKLGSYAMLRGTWVEAYYWMYRAQRTGQVDVAIPLRDIRRNWMLDGCPTEMENVNDLFSAKQGSVARAILDIAANRNADDARKFLQANHPELL